MKKDKSELRRVAVHKNLLDYLFDFFMLFLAVTLGFFSNNLRENIIDRNTEKDYMVRLIRDVENDTSDIRTLVIKERAQLFGMDTLLQTFERNNLQPPVNEFYRLMFKYLATYNGFQPRNITYNQLKTAGDMNLISDRAVRDSIIYYYDRISAYDEQGKYNQEFFQKIIDMEMMMMDYSVFRVPGKINTIRHPEEFPKLYNHILIMGSFVGQDRVWQNQVKANGERLLDYLKKKYALN